jgi:hypothetical protein
MKQEIITLKRLSIKKAIIFSCSNQIKMTWITLITVVIHAFLPKSAFRSLIWTGIASPKAMLLVLWFDHLLPALLKNISFYQTKCACDAICVVAR